MGMLYPILLGALALGAYGCAGGINNSSGDTEEVISPRSERTRVPLPGNYIRVPETPGTYPYDTDIETAVRTFMVPTDPAQPMIVALGFDHTQGAKRFKTSAGRISDDILPEMLRYERGNQDFILEFLRNDPRSEKLLRDFRQKGTLSEKLKALMRGRDYCSFVNILKSVVKSGARIFGSHLSFDELPDPSRLWEIYKGEDAVVWQKVNDNSREQIERSRKQGRSVSILCGLFHIYPDPADRYVQFSFGDEYRSYPNYRPVIVLVPEEVESDPAWIDLEDWERHIPETGTKLIVRRSGKFSTYYIIYPRTPRERELSESQIYNCTKRPF